MRRGGACVERLGLGPRFPGCRRRLEKGPGPVLWATASQEPWICVQPPPMWALCGVPFLMPALPVSPFTGTSSKAPLRPPWRDLCKTSLSPDLNDRLSARGMLWE